MAVLAGRGRAQGALHGVLLACAMSLSFIGRGSAQGQRFNEQDVKAVFLFNFAHFTEWPAQAFPDARAPLVIGLLGDDPFGRALDEAVAGETVRNRPLVVSRFRRVEDIGACHILFISSSEARSHAGIFARLEGRPILTVGETEGFARRGGMIRFVSEQTRIRLRVNVGAIRSAGLVVSSRLLRAAEIVDTAHTP